MLDIKLLGYMFILNLILYFEFNFIYYSGNYRLLLIMKSKENEPLGFCYFYPSNHPYYVTYLFNIKYPPYFIGLSDSKNAFFWILY